MTNEEKSALLAAARLLIELVNKHEKDRTWVLVRRTKINE